MKSKKCENCDEIIIRTNFARDDYWLNRRFCTDVCYKKWAYINSPKSKRVALFVRTDKTRVVERMLADDTARFLKTDRRFVISRSGRVFSRAGSKFGDLPWKELRFAKSGKYLGVSLGRGWLK